MPDPKDCYKTTVVDGSKTEEGDVTIEIYSLIEEKVIGTYTCEFDFGVDLFYPFRYKNKDYALYSPDHTCSRVMALPSCEDIGGEEQHTFGFCPMEFYVPTYTDFPNNYYLPKDMSPSDAEYPFGFVAGCIWGDDSSLKLQVVDFKNIEKGEVTFDDRLGYVELPYPVASIKDAILSILYDPTGNRSSYIRLSEMSEKYIYDKDTSKDLKESNLRTSHIVFNVIFVGQTSLDFSSYAVPLRLLLDDGFQEALYGAILVEVIDKDSDKTLYQYLDQDKEGFVSPSREEELLRYYREFCLVTGKTNPVNKEEELVYNTWLEHQVKGDYLVKSFDALYTVYVTVS